MKPLREWIREQLVPLSKMIRNELTHLSGHYDAGWRDGYAVAMQEMLNELKFREDAERERVNENLNALDRYAGEALKDKEGSPDDA